MKKIISLLVVFTLILTLGFGINGVQAAQNAVTVSASVDNSTEKATINGVLTGGLNKNINVIVYDPDNSRIDFMDNQVIASTDGSFTFSYILGRKAAGTYTVKVFGPEAEETASTTFKYTGVSTGGGGYIPGPAQIPAPTPTPTPTPTPKPTPTPVPEEKPVHFKDVGAEYAWAKEAIDTLSAKGIIKGTGADTFEPAANITRADFVLLLVRVLDLKGDAADSFSDIGKEDYYYNAVGMAKKLGITMGDGNNRFNPEEEISRQDMMVLCFRALEVTGKLKVSPDIAKLDKFHDKNDIAEYAVNALSAMVNSGLIVGDNDLLKPDSNTTRAETAVLIYRILKLLPK